MKQYVLASASPRRIELIKMIGIEAEVVPSTLEENADTDDPERLVRELALQKARDIAARYHDGEIVIGADTCVYAGESILGKPKSKDEAMAMLAMLQGNVHRVYTGVALVRCGGDRSSESGPGNNSREVYFVEKTNVHVYPMTAEEILAYVETGEPMDKAGAYAIQGAFCRYIEKIEGDYYNVMGLPVGRLYQTLKEMRAVRGQ